MLRSSRAHPHLGHIPGSARCASFRLERDRNAANPQSAVRRVALTTFIGGLPTKVATNAIRRALVNLLRRSDLLQFAGIHHRDQIGHGERLGLIVGHVQRRRSESLAQALQFASHA